MNAKYLIDDINKDRVVMLRRCRENFEIIGPHPFFGVITQVQNGVLSVKLDEDQPGHPSSCWWRKHAYFYPIGIRNFDYYTTKSWHSGSYVRLESLWHVQFNASKAKVNFLLNQ